MGFLPNKTNNTPPPGALPEREKNRQTQRGYDVFLYPLPLQDDGGGWLFFRNHAAEIKKLVPSEKKKTLHTGKGIPDLFEFKSSDPIGIKKK